MCAPVRERTYHAVVCVQCERARGFSAHGAERPLDALERASLCVGRTTWLVWPSACSNAARVWLRVRVRSRACVCVCERKSEGERVCVCECE